MELLITALFVLMAIIAFFKFISRFFGSSVCIECYKKVKVRKAIKAQMRNKDMYRCYECSDKLKFHI